MAQIGDFIVVPPPAADFLARLNFTLNGEYIGDASASEVVVPSGCAQPVSGVVIREGG